jgi:uncharacterized cupin superfamily protein
MKPESPKAIRAAEAAPRNQASNYPEPFASRNFGVNLTRLAPGAVSAPRHAHTKRPDDDLQAVVGSDGKWRFTRKDGTGY